MGAVSAHPCPQEVLHLQPLQLRSSIFLHVLSGAFLLSYSQPKVTEFQDV